MKTPEEHFEQARQEYLSHSFPGDLAKMLEDRQVTVPSTEPAEPEPGNKRFLSRVVWTLAALVLIGITTSLVYWAGNRTAARPVAANKLPDLAKVKSPVKEAKPWQPFDLSRPVALKMHGPPQAKTKFFTTPVRSSSDKTQLPQQSSLSLFGTGDRQPKKMKLWTSGSIQLAKQQPVNDASQTQASKPSSKRDRSRSRIKFRNRFRFEPIRIYRRT